jgi:hypothetical protein
MPLSSARTGPAASTGHAARACRGAAGRDKINAALIIACHYAHDFPAD